MSLDLSVSSSEDLTLKLCTFLTSLKYEDIPADVAHMAKASILNSIGCGLSSSPSSLPAAAKLYAALDPTAKSPRPATVLATAEKAAVDDAAILNGLMMTARFFDDTHLSTLTHPSGPPLAAVMAYAEAEGLSGQDLILAFIVGVEVGLTLTKALGLGPYKKGWHLTGIVGSFSAAAAVSSLMKLDAHAMAMALGHASSMASGSRNVFATDTLIVHAGCAARNGILAARLASKDFGSTTNALEKWINLMSVAGEESHPQRILDLLQDKNGKRDWALLENAFKPYPCGIVIHPLIDAGIEARREILGNQCTADNVLEIVQKIEATVSPMTIRLCGIRHPQELVQTLFSNYHGLSVGLIYGAGGLKQFSKEVADEAVVAGIRDRITLVPNESFRDNQAVVKFWYTVDGVEHTKEVTIEHALGSLENPMTADQLNAKFEDQAVVGGLEQANVRKAISLLWDLDKVADIQPLMRLLVPAVASSYTSGG
jgi:aconitate decarboxylase